MNFIEMKLLFEELNIKFETTIHPSNTSKAKGVITAYWNDLKIKVSEIGIEIEGKVPSLVIERILKKDKDDNYTNFCGSRSLEESLEDQKSFLTRRATCDEFEKLKEIVNTMYIDHSDKKIIIELFKKNLLKSESNAKIRYFDGIYISDLINFIKFYTEMQDYKLRQIIGDKEANLVSPLNKQTIIKRKIDLVVLQELNLIEKIDYINSTFDGCLKEMDILSGKENAIRELFIISKNNFINLFNYITSLKTIPIVYELDYKVDNNLISLRIKNKETNNIFSIFLESSEFWKFSELSDIKQCGFMLDFYDSEQRKSSIGCCYDKKSHLIVPLTIEKVNKEPKYDYDDIYYYSSSYVLNDNVIVPMHDIGCRNATNKDVLLITKMLNEINGRLLYEASFVQNCEKEIDKVETQEGKIR